MTLLVGGDGMEPISAEKSVSIHVHSIPKGAFDRLVLAWLLGLGFALGAAFGMGVLEAITQILRAMGVAS